MLNEAFAGGTKEVVLNKHEVDCGEISNLLALFGKFLVSRYQQNKKIDIFYCDFHLQIENCGFEP